MEAIGHTVAVGWVSVWWCTLQRGVSCCSGKPRARFKGCEFEYFKALRPETKVELPEKKKKTIQGIS